MGLWGGIMVLLCDVDLWCQFVMWIRDVDLWCGFVMCILGSGFVKWN